MGKKKATTKTDGPGKGHKFCSNQECKKSIPAGMTICKHCNTRQKPKTKKAKKKRTAKGSNNVTDAITTARSLIDLTGSPESAKAVIEALKG